MTPLQQTISKLSTSLCQSVGGLRGDGNEHAPFIGQDFPMRLDHVSYVTSHDQLADTVQRLGSRLGSTFVDGGHL